MTQTKHPLPSSGGSYKREADGSLTAIATPQPAADAAPTQKPTAKAAKPASKPAPKTEA